MSRALPSHGTDPAGEAAAGGSRSRRSRSAAEAPLGSLTQPQHRHGQTCRQCGSERVTRLVMRLTDGTPVEFVSCHRCESRVWEHDGAVLEVANVIDRTRKIA